MSHYKLCRPTLQPLAPACHPLHVPFFLLALAAVLFFSPSAGQTALKDVLVGTTAFGGPYGSGTIFSLKPNATSVTGPPVYTVHKSFSFAGSHPRGDLIKGKDGFFYGIASSFFFKMTKSGAVVLVKEIGFSSGSPLQATDGNFYYMTDQGFILRTTSAGVTTQVANLNDLTSNSKPVGNLIQATDGNFYGMTSAGGTNNAGMLFRMTPAGNLTILKHFDFSSTGGKPLGSLVQGKDGALYGMTQEGGENGDGTIFKVSLSGVFTLLKNLSAPTTGAKPKGNLIQATDGNLYGMTYEGGQFGSGTIFRMTASGTITVLQHLDFASTGGFPHGSLVQGTDGNFYGMTSNDNVANSFGTLFRMTPTGIITVLYSLNKNTDGANPRGSLHRDEDGNFYGMITRGGPTDQGTVFRLSGAGAFTLLYRFPDDGTGYYRTTDFNGRLQQATDGFFYGMTQEGGTSPVSCPQFIGTPTGGGSAFKFCTNGSFTTLNSISASTNGAYPNGSLIQAKDGYLYGITKNAIDGDGIAFKMTTSGTMLVLNSSLGAPPTGNLLQAADGFFYGMGRTSPSFIFQMDSRGTTTVFKYFSGWIPNGGEPHGSLIQASDGNFYGMTYNGGSFNRGTVFRVTPSKELVVLVQFNLSSTGGYPEGDLVQASDGHLYGMTSMGGMHNMGTIFRLTLGGVFTVMKHFDQSVTGGNPYGSLVEGTNGVLYGMATSGGTNGAGTIFRLVPSSNTLTVLRHFTATDGGGQGSLVVQKPNPVANPQSISTAVGTIKKVKLTATAGGSPLSYFLANGPKNGVATITGDELTYTPTSGYTGKDSLYFTATWGCQTSTPAKVLITVGGGSTAPALSGMTLVNATTNQDIGPLTSGMTIDLSVTPGINIRANPASGAQVGSVRFALNSNTNYKTESVAPFTIAGDNGTGDYYNWAITPGQYTIKATPYSASSAGGTAGTPVSVTVTINQSSQDVQVMALEQRIEDNSQEREPWHLVAYPNPVTGSNSAYIEFSLPNSTQANVTLLDATGREVQRVFSGKADGGVLYKRELNLHTLAKGVYVVRLLTSEGKWKTRQFVYQ